MNVKALFLLNVMMNMAVVVAGSSNMGHASVTEYHSFLDDLSSFSSDMKDEVFSLFKWEMGGVNVSSFTMMNLLEEGPTEASWTTPYMIIKTLFWAMIVNALIVIGFFTLKISLSHNKAKAPFGKDVPITPEAHWLVGHAFTFWDYKKSLTTKYKELFGANVVNDMGLGSIFLGMAPFLVVTRCEDVQNVLRTSSTTAVSPQVRRHYAKRAGDNEALAHLAQGKVWRTKRQFVHKIFTRNLPNCTDGMVKVARDLSTSVLNLIRSSKKISTDFGVPTCLVDVERITTLAMFDNFGIMAFGHDFGVCKTLKEHKVAVAIAHQFDDFEGRVKDLFNPCSQFYSIPTKKNLARQATDETIRNFYRSKVEERLNGESEGNGTDVLSFLKKAIDDEKDSGTTIHSSVELLQTLFNGATTTSAGTLMFALYAASEIPRVEKRILDEVKRVIGPRTVDEETKMVNVGELQYCRAVILETVRLYPSIPANTRVLEHDTELGGKMFKPGTKVMLPVFAVQRDERHYPKPLEFYPERWVEPNEDGLWVPRNFKNYSSKIDLVDGVPPANREAFVAFSSGGRNCVGQRLAVHQTTIGLAYLVRDIKMKVSTEYVLDLYYEGITMRPRYGMPMNCIERTFDDKELKVKVEKA